MRSGKPFQVDPYKILTMGKSSRERFGPRQIAASPLITSIRNIQIIRVSICQSGCVEEGDNEPAKIQRGAAVSGQALQAAVI